jgi:hypothetical protein
MVRLIILFRPAIEADWLSREERRALNDYYAARYDTEIEDDVPSFRMARQLIEAHVRAFMATEKGALVDQRYRVTIAPLDSDQREERPYTGLHYANDTLVPQQLLSEMAWLQVMQNACLGERCIVASVYIFSPYSSDEHRRLAVLKAAMLRPDPDAPRFSLHSLAGNPELLRQITEDGVPYRPTPPRPS